jgi:type II secretory pathway pseudopilin PulG
MLRAATNLRTTTRSHCRPLTLVEMTIILSVIAILTAVLVPTVMSHITQARILRARQDVRTLSEAIVRQYQDMGFVPQTRDSRNGGPGSSAIHLLVSPGNTPACSPDSHDTTDWQTTDADYLENHLMNNVPGYRLKAIGGTGWNGPYLATSPESDPWGNRYMINIEYFDSTTGALGADGAVKLAVFVISAGQDGTIDTAYSQPLTDVNLRGDDIAHRLQ